MSCLILHHFIFSLLAHFDGTDNQRREQLALFEDVFFKLLKFIISQRRNLGLKLRVDFQIDHTHTPLSPLLRPFFLPEKGRNILFCGFQLEQFLFSFLVLLVKLRFFGYYCSILSFQFFRAGQLGDVVCLGIGCCRPVRCQLCMMLLLNGCGSLYNTFIAVCKRVSDFSERNGYIERISGKLLRMCVRKVVRTYAVILRNFFYNRDVLLDDSMIYSSWLTVA